MIKAWSLMLCLLLLGGCTALPAEERSFAVVLGIDCQEEEWHTYTRVPTYQTGGGYATVSGKGASLGDAMADMNGTSSLALHLGQLRMVIVSEAMISAGLLPEVLTFLCDRSDTRLQAWVCAADEDVQPLMDGMTPATGTRLSKFIESFIMTRREEGSAMPVTAGELYMMEARQTPVLPLLSMKEKELTLTGGLPLTLNSRAGSRLTNDEVQLLAIMSGQTRQGDIRLGSGTARLMDTSAEIRLAGDHAAASVQLTMRLDMPEERCKSQEVDTALRLRTLLSGLTGEGCDVLGLGRKAALGAVSAAELREMDWPAVLRNMRWTVSLALQPAA